jgi:hypothetical protein
MARCSPQECRLKSCSWLPSSTLRGPKSVYPSSIPVVPTVVNITVPDVVAVVLGVVVSFVVEVVSVVVVGANITSHVEEPSRPLMHGMIT